MIVSKDNLIKLFQTASKDDQLAKELQSANDYGQLQRIAGEHGCNIGDLREEEAVRTLGVATGAIKDELSEEELEAVAGGFLLEISGFKVALPATWRKDLAKLSQEQKGDDT